jgi:hypothetical protein
MNHLFQRSMKPALVVSFRGRGGFSIRTRSTPSALHLRDVAATLVCPPTHKNTAFWPIRSPPTHAAPESDGVAIGGRYLHGQIVCLSTHPSVRAEVHEIRECGLCESMTPLRSGRHWASRRRRQFGLLRGNRS